MNDAQLHRFGEVRPRIAAVLWPLNPKYRMAVLETAREIGGERFGGWESIVTIVAAAAQAGASLHTLREILNGRAWSANASVATQGENGRDTHW